MTAQEAIMVIQSIPEKVWDMMSKSEEDAIDLAYEALEKQIPKKVTNNKFNIPFCPSCKSVQSGETYCNKCGQKLKWW